MGRWIRFLIVFTVGVAAGLFYGWVVSPVQYKDTTPDTLRADYQADYVLMVAEVYEADGDLALAVRRLAILGAMLPDEIVANARRFGEQFGYAQADLRRIRSLEEAVKSWDPAFEAPVP